MADNPFPHLPWFPEAVRKSEEIMDKIPVESWPSQYLEMMDRKTRNDD
ncbi:hypothetical protein QEH42_gp275 [Microbacterium phage Pumpernickel]|uniref:Uncharacterized protein n=1 Tax=Microbacterium phage Pumpernickel TaxID=2885983 RepID=A0AAE8Y8E8_9CAUD|nr:hypothetical protein QEH42_gp275 [Microbacterium phage Pumpernickel]UDL15943.1 hypothetical protein SEA_PUMPERNICKEL_193 [Microbacterium phage Pumpernickel]